MNHNTILCSMAKRAVFALIHRGLAFLVFAVPVVSTLMGQTQTEPRAASEKPAIHVKHVLGFEATHHNTNGGLEISGDKLQFNHDGSVTAQVAVSSIQSIFLGQTDEQVGGPAMTLGKAAAPFGGGRAVSLFAHKKYDSLTIEYVDNDGGLHGAIFRLRKGQGQILKTALIASGVPTSPAAAAPTQATPEAGNDK